MPCIKHLDHLSSIKQKFQKGAWSKCFIQGIVQHKVKVYTTPFINAVKFFYIIKDRCQMHALKVFRSPVWLLLHKLSSPHYRYIRKMQRGDRLPLTQLTNV
jgi:hypothetical protein